VVAFLSGSVTLIGYKVLVQIRSLVNQLCQEGVVSFRAPVLSLENVVSCGPSLVLALAVGAGGVGNTLFAPLVQPG